MGELIVDSLRKDYPNDGETTTAVDNLNLSIQDGEFLVLVGPSGCGKSTTLRCIAGLEDVSAGNIIQDGEDVTDYSSSERDMAMVFQDYALYPHMTARENMAFGLKMGTDMSTSEIRDRVDEVAEMSGITELLEQKPAELSGGQQQRVALGRAVVRDPETFLMDEPLSNLDAKLRAHLRTELQDLQQKLGVTTIYVTHDQTEAMTMGDRIAVLNHGKLQQVGTPLECYDKPKNEFVASFIGSPSINLVDVVHQDGTLQSESFEYEVSDSVADILEAADTEEFRLGVRPEDIHQARDDTTNQLSVTVEVIEPVGNESHVYVDIGETDWITTFDSNAPIQVGNQLSLTFDEDSIHIFEKGSGVAIKNKTDSESRSPVVTN